MTNRDDTELCTQYLIGPSVRTILWTLGEPTIFYNGGGGGDVRALAMDMPATSVCTILALYKHYIARP